MEWHAARELTALSAQPPVRETAGGLGEMAEVVLNYALDAAFGPLTWVPVYTLEQSLDVIQEADPTNVRVAVSSDN